MLVWLVFNKAGTLLQYIGPIGDAGDGDHDCGDDSPQRDTSSSFFCSSNSHFFNKAWCAKRSRVVVTPWGTSDNCEHWSQWSPAVNLQTLENGDGSKPMKLHILSPYLDIFLGEITSPLTSKLLMFLLPFMSHRTLSYVTLSPQVFLGSTLIRGGSGVPSRTCRNTSRTKTDKIRDVHYKHIHIRKYSINNHK